MTVVNFMATLLGPQYDSGTIAGPQEGFRKCYRDG